MFFPEGQIRVFVYGRPVSMRLSYDGLYALAKQTMRQDPLSGNLFAFGSKTGGGYHWSLWSPILMPNGSLEYGFDYPIMQSIRYLPE